MADFSLCGGRHFFFFLTAQKDLPHEKLHGGIVRISTLQMKKLRPAGEGVGLGLRGLLSAAVGCGSHLVGGRSDQVYPAEGSTPTDRRREPACQTSRWSG